MIRASAESRNGGHAAAQPGAPLIAARGIVKRFGELLANDIDAFEVRSGEVHALLGENGAGKTTLSKILYGYYRPDAGEILVRGVAVAMASPAHARALGIGMVFQEFTLVPALSVFENIVLFMQGLPAILDRRALAAQIASAAQRLGIATPLQVPVRALAVGEQQKVEILKQVLGGARVLILDEPTKVLAPQERSALFALIGELRAEGYGVVFITHKLNEVMEIADRVSVMRKGRIAGVVERAQTTEAGLMALMFEGRAPQEVPPKTPRAPGPAALELREVSAVGEAHAMALSGISLRVCAGEIVGVAGVTGSGQRELGDLAMGKIRPSRGAKLLWGEDAGKWSTARVRQAGAAFVPENPIEIACVGELTVAENFALGAPRYRGGLGIDWARVRSDAEAAFAHLGFPRPALDARVRTLSGGNVQRAVMAREFSTGPRLIVALYPTRGLDAQSAQALREKLAASAAGGAAVLLMSEDLDELFGLCDRLLVLHQGRISGEFAPPGFTQEAVGAAMVGAAGVRRAA
jgi:general nucleoside transport system ATP-binding protein